MQRFDFIKSLPACINCLKQGLAVARCKSTKCSVCGSSHHCLLHRYTSSSNSNIESEWPSTFQAFVHHAFSDDSVILTTAVVQVKDISGKFEKARALLDSGSQTNLITEDLAQRLKIKKEGGKLNWSSICDTKSCANASLQMTVKSRINNTQFCSRFWVLSTITNNPPDEKIEIRNWSILLCANSYSSK